MDTESILQQKTETSKQAGNGTRNTQHNFLASEVTTSHPAARAYVNLLLGNYTKCETIEQLRNHRTAITRECFVRRNFTDSHLNPQVYKRWFIGERAAPRQIEQRETRIKDIASELTQLNKRETALRERLVLSRDKIRPFVELEAALPSLSRLAPLEAELTSIKSELAALDSRTVESLKAEVEKCQRERDQLQSEAATLERRLGNLEEKIKQIETESIPGLERSADESIQNADSFLFRLTGVA